MESLMFWISGLIAVAFFRVTIGLTWKAINRAMKVSDAGPPP